MKIKSIREQAMEGYLQDWRKRTDLVSWLEKQGEMPKSDGWGDILENLKEMEGRENV